MIRKFLLLSLASVVSVWAQGSAGSIVVTAQDATGAVVPGASVTATNDTTNTASHGITDERGRVQLLSLNPSTYTLSVSHPGLKGYVRKNVIVNVNETVSVTAELQVGDVSESVQVVAASPLLEQETSALGQVIERRKVQDLPLNGRNVFALAALTAGVSPGQGFNNGPLNLTQLSISGGRNGAAEILVDGVPVTVPENSPGTMVAAILPSVDRVQEFKVQTNAFSAEYGRNSGGILNVAIRSGTNDLHGSVYEFLRNSALDANNFFLNRTGRPLTPFRRNQYGFELGGPIYVPGLYNGRNRTFIFGGWEGLRESSQSASTTTLPTAQELTGDFTDTTVRIFDPLTTRQNPGSTPAVIRDQFPGNRIPAARIDPVIAKAVTYYPKPTDAGRVNNFVASGSSKTSDNAFDIRVDHNIGSKQKLFGRASYRDYAQDNPNYYNTAGNPGAFSIPRPGHSGAFGDTYIFRPNLLGNFHYGYARLFTARKSFSDGFDATQLGLPQSLVANADRKVFPLYQPAGYGALGAGGVTNARFGLENHSWQYSMTWIKGRHSIKFGTDDRLNHSNFLQIRNPMGVFGFTAGFTQGPDPNVASAAAGLSIASMMLGDAASGQATRDVATSTQSFYYAAYVQDDIKVSKSLTLNIGLRYDIEIPRSERYNRLSVFDPTVKSPLTGIVPGFTDLRGGLTFVGVDRPKQYTTDHNDLGPRFGFAWNVDRKTVLRGGYGLFYSPSSMTAAGTTGGGGVAAFFTQTTMINTIDGGLTPADRVSNPFPAGLISPPGSSQRLLSLIGSQFPTPSPYDVVPYVQQFNFNIQREIIPNLLVEVAYAGSRGEKLPVVTAALNQLRPEQLALGARLQTRVANPFFGIIKDPASSLSLPTTTLGQLVRPFPQFLDIDLEKATFAASVYHAMEVRVDRRFSQGLSLLAAYTASKSIDNGSNSGTGISPPFAFIQNYYNMKAERGLSVFDIPQRFIVSSIYEIPFGTGRHFGAAAHPLLKAALGGWQVNGILTFAKGAPLILANAQDNSGSLNSAGAVGGNTERPNNNGKSGKLDGPIVDRLNRYFDTSVFSQPAPFTFGNTSRTSPDLRAPGVASLDLSLFKSFPIHESLALQFRAEAFNFTNTPNFAGPATVFGPATFGVISAQANAPRQVQFALRLSF